MATRFFGDAKPWVRITKRVEETKGRVVAAIAYVAIDAPDLLPLKELRLLRGTPEMKRFWRPQRPGQFKTHGISFSRRHLEALKLSDLTNRSCKRSWRSSRTTPNGMKAANVSRSIFRNVWADY